MNRIPEEKGGSFGLSPPLYSGLRPTEQKPRWLSSWFGRARKECRAPHSRAHGCRDGLRCTSPRGSVRPGAFLGAT